MSEQADLIAKLSEATAGSRNLDMMLAQHFGWRLHATLDFWMKPSWWTPLTVIEGVPYFTTSVDAILALIEKRLPGWYWGAGPGTATLLDEKMPGMFRVDARGATAQLALCIALLRSLQAQQTAALKPEGGET